MTCSAIVFDLDGTLIDSNPVKRRGFDHIFAAHKKGADIVELVLEKHRKAFRTVVIGAVLEQLHAVGEHGCEPTDDRVAEYAERYNRFCIEGAVACEEIPGATQALKGLTMTHQLFINTATATQAAEEIIDRREWSQYFRGVLGFPPSKIENLQTVAQQVGVRNHEIVMVGDDDHDAEAANAFGCPFIAVQRTCSHFTHPPSVFVKRLEEMFLLKIVSAS